MEYVYAAMLLHKAGQEVNDANLKRVLEAAGVKADDSRVKVLVAALSGVDIEKAIKEAAQGAAAQAAAAPAEKKKADPEEEKVSQEEAAAGLGALFG